MPILGLATAQVFAVALCTEDVARCVARAAMGEALGQIGAAIEYRREHRIGLEFARPEEKQLPAGDQLSKLEWELQLVWRRLCPHRLPRHQERINGSQIRRRHFGEVIVWKGWVEVRAVAPYALLHCTQESGLRPAPETRLDIRCDIGRKDRPEWRRHWTAAGIRRTIGPSVTDSTIAEARQLGTPSDCGAIESSRRAMLAW